MKYTLCLIALLSSIFTNAQSGITTIAGTGAYGCAGDGGTATSASLSEPYAIARDTLGNIFVADKGCHKIRKITPAGIISTIAGTGTLGFSGDGGPATLATLGYPSSVATDLAGNVYFVDVYSRRIRKVNAAGIISTIAGDGFNGFAGDGGPAVLARFNTPHGIATDNLGNIYIADYNNLRIRKINSAGFISTVAGNGSTGFAGDGGPATAASLYLPRIVAVDKNNTLYFSDGLNRRIRKVDGSGIINTVAGNGIEGDSGDGGPATLASINAFSGSISFDLTGNLYLAHENKIRKIGTNGIITSLPNTLSYSYGLVVDGENTIYANNAMNVVKLALLPYASSDSMDVNVTNLCGDVKFTVVTKRFSPAFTVKTFFGDNSIASTAVSNNYGSGYAIVNHSYAHVGLFVVKHVLFNGPVAIDSVSYSYQRLLCKTIPVSFYFDANENCVRESATEPLINMSMKVAVDSNGIPVDTVSCLSGFYYNATGNLNDVYSFRLLSYPAGLVPVCPASGIVSDTLNGLSITHNTKYLALKGIVSPDYDLKQYSSVRTGRHKASGIITSANDFCSPNYGVVTLKISPKFVYESSFPLPSSITPTSVSWNIAPLSPAYGNPQKIEYTLSRPTDSAWLLPGDTVHSTIIIGPYTSDIDTQNNVKVRCDTVKSSYDPNMISVAPEGAILPCTKLRYSVQFENDGNDTAHNIYVLDTLPAYVDASTVIPVAASANMFYSIIHSGPYNIVKFDFPSIMLPDSSHHNLCHGMFVFDVTAKMGLADGTIVMNRVGIYFDDNPVVMTNEVRNVVGVSPITGPSVLCVGSAATLQHTTSGGSWSSSMPGIAAVSSTGIVGGSTPGTATISYTISNGCVTRFVTHNVSVLSLESPTVILSVTPDDTVCIHSAVSFSASPTFGGAFPIFKWFVNGAFSGYGATYSYMPASADFVYCRLISDYACRIADSVNSPAIIMHTDSAFIPSIDIVSSPGLSISSGELLTLHAVVTGGGPTPLYQWYVNGAAIAGATTDVYASASFVNTDSVTCIVTGSGACESKSYESVIVTISTHVAEIMFDKVSIFPNPTNGCLSIVGQFENGKSSPLTIEIIDALGRIALKEYFIVSGLNFSHVISLPNTLPNGPYLLVLKSSNETKKIPVSLIRTRN